MKSSTTADSRRAFRRLPHAIQARGRRAYRKFREDPFHSSLAFKRVHAGGDVRSARVEIGWRALDFRHGERVVGFWIGSHAEYDAWLRRR